MGKTNMMNNVTGARKILETFLNCDDLEDFYAFLNLLGDCYYIDESDNKVYKGSAFMTLTGDEFQVYVTFEDDKKDTVILDIYECAYYLYNNEKEAKEMLDYYVG